MPTTMIRKAVYAFLIAFPSLATAVTGAFENPQPNSPQSGVGLISGWVCPPVGQIQVAFDGGAGIGVPYGSARADTGSSCGGQINTGFGLLFNYNTLGVGSHTAVAYADGAVIGSAQFTVTTLGSEFLTGALGSARISNFPSAGKRVFLAWQQATQNFAITAIDSNAPNPNDTFTGAFLGINTSCGPSTGPFAFNNAQFAITQTGTTLNVHSVFTGQTPSSCTLAGTIQNNVNGHQYIVQSGTFSCNDGTSGNWSATDMHFSSAGFLAAATFTQANGCVTTANMAGARAP